MEHTASIETYPSPLQGPPSLQYDLRTRKTRICIFWGMVLLDSMVIPVILYFTLWKGSGLDHNTVYNIISATLAGTTILEYIQRTYRLCRKNSTCRVTGAKWYFMDAFQWIITLDLTIVIILVMYGGSGEHPKVRMLALVAPSFLLMFAIILLTLEVLRSINIQAPFAISSMPRGSILRPAIYLVVEDIIAVDGGGGTDFRKRLDTRFRSSVRFRALLGFLSLYLIISGMLVGVVTVIMVFETNKSTGYLLGWCAPFVWASVSTIVTIKVAQDGIAFEKANWGIDNWVIDEFRILS